MFKHTSTLLTTILFLLLPAFIYAKPATTPVVQQTNITSQDLGRSTSMSIIEDMQVELNEDDLLVVQVSYEDLLLEEALFIYQTPESTFVPVQGLFEALDFPLVIDIDAQTIDGWFISETSKFSLDIPKQAIFIKGHAQTWPDNFRFAMDGFDLYINLNTLEKWFGLKLNLDVSQLKLKLESELPLPVILSKQREIKRQQIAKTSKTTIPNYLPNQYDWLAQPGLDIELTYDLERQGSESVEHFRGAVLQGNMDVLKHSMSSSYIYQNGEEDLRITFSRSAEGPDKTMLLGLDFYEAGDITSHSDNLLFGSVTGSGVHFKRGKSSLLEQSTDILIEGDAPPGWEVELYRNGSLVNFASASASGQYKFENITTFVGENIFDIRIYGPQGQKRSRQKKITVGANMVSKGEWEYQFYGLIRNSNLISSELNQMEETSEFYHSEVSYGLSEFFTLQAGINKMEPTETDISHEYSFLSLFGSVGGNLAQIKIAHDSEGGNGIASSFKSRLYDTNINIDILKFNHLVSERSENGQLKLDAKIRASGLLQELTSQAITYDVEVRHSAYRESDLKQLQISKRLSTRWGLTQLSHNLNYSHSNVDESEDTLDSSLSATRQWRDWRLKAEINYGIQPKDQLQSINTAASYQQGSAYTFQTGLNYSQSENDIISLSNTITWNLKPVSLSLTAGIDNDEMYFLGLSLNTSLGYDNAKGSFWFNDAGSSATASVLAHAYVDDNNNGTYDPLEPPLEGVIFKGRNAWQESPTDKQGYTILTGIPALSLQPISIDERSIEDPYMKIRQPEYHLYSHAGKQTELSFQLVPTVEIEGELYVRTWQASSEQLAGLTDEQVQANERALPNVKLFILNETGETIATTRSEYDGIFLFEGILPGKYQLRIESEQLQKRNLKLPEDIPFDVKGSEGVLYLNKISLLSNHKESSLNQTHKNQTKPL